jgi:uncharacterized protein
VSMHSMDFRNKWVLVTGASSGLGKEMAEQLAIVHGCNLVVSARRSDKLEALKADLEKKAGVKVEVVTADMTKLDDVDKLLERVMGSFALYGAVLNAGITHFGDYHELAWDDFQRLLHTNVTSVVRMTTQLLPYLEKRGEGGGVMIVSSMGGLQPVPYQTVYSASKAFLINFGCGLFHELDGKNVSITTYAPGGIATDMTAGNRFDGLRGWLAPVDDVAREGLHAFQHRKYLHVPGLMYRVGAVLTRMLPQQIVTGRVASEYRKALAKAKDATRS